MFFLIIHEVIICCPPPTVTEDPELKPHISLVDSSVSLLSDVLAEMQPNNDVNAVLSACPNMSLPSFHKLLPHDMKKQLPHHGHGHHGRMQRP